MGIDLYVINNEIEVNCSKVGNIYSGYCAPNNLLTKIQDGVSSTQDVVVKVDVTSKALHQDYTHLMHKIFPMLNSGTDNIFDPYVDQNNAGWYRSNYLKTRVYGGRNPKENQCKI